MAMVGEQERTQGGQPRLEAAGSERLQSLLARLEQSAPALERVLDAVETLDKSGALNTLVDLAGFLQAATDSLTPEVLSGVVRKVGDTVLLLDQLSEATAMLTPGLLSALQAAQQEIPARPVRGGLLPLLRAVNDPDTQAGLQFMLGILRHWGRTLASTGADGLGPTAGLRNGKSGSPPLDDPEHTHGIPEAPARV